MLENCWNLWQLHALPENWVNFGFAYVSLIWMLARVPYEIIHFLGQMTVETVPVSWHTAQIWVICSADSEWHFKICECLLHVNNVDEVTISCFYTLVHSINMYPKLSQDNDICSAFNVAWPWMSEYLLFYIPLKNFSLIWRRHHCR
jgi:hypothetical protein